MFFSTCCWFELQKCHIASFSIAGILANTHLQGYLGIFSIGYKAVDATIAASAAVSAMGSNPAAVAEVLGGATDNASPALAPAGALAAAAAASPPVGNMLLHCERFWQTAGSGVERGAVVNTLVVVTAASQTSSASAVSGAADSANTLPIASTASSSTDGMVTANDGENGCSQSGAADAIQTRVEAILSGVVTVLDYGSSLAVWRKT